MINAILAIGCLVKRSRDDEVSKAPIAAHNHLNAATELQNRWMVGEATIAKIQVNLMLNCLRFH